MSWLARAARSQAACRSGCVWEGERDGETEGQRGRREQYPPAKMAAGEQSVRERERRRDEDGTQRKPQNTKKKKGLMCGQQTGVQFDKGSAQTEGNPSKDGDIRRDRDTEREREGEWEGAGES